MQHGHSCQSEASRSSQSGRIGDSMISREINTGDSVNAPDRLLGCSALLDHYENKEPRPAVEFSSRNIQCTISSNCSMKQVLVAASEVPVEDRARQYDEIKGTIFVQYQVGNQYYFTTNRCYLLVASSKTFTFREFLTVINNDSRRYL